MRVAIVTVGDELLAGQIVNTNASWLAEQLTERGCRVERITTVPDRIEAIAELVAEYRSAYDAVVVTGGLGPTPDDVTIAAVARAVDRELTHHEAAHKWFTDNGGYTATDVDDSTTELPAGGQLLPNEVGAAPGVVVDSVYVLPGIPSEMKAMFAAVAEEFTGEPTYTETVVVDEPESALLDRLAEVAEQFEVRVGSYPGETVRVKLSGADPDAVSAAANWFEARADVVSADHEQ